MINKQKQAQECRTKMNLSNLNYQHSIHTAFPGTRRCRWCHCEWMWHCLATLVATDDYSLRHSVPVPIWLIWVQPLWKTLLLLLRSALMHMEYVPELISVVSEGEKRIFFFLIIFFITELTMRASFCHRPKRNEHN